MNIKNIKVYAKLKNKKQVLIRNSAAVLLSLTLVTPLAGCFNSDNYKSNNYDYSNYNSNNNQNENDSQFSNNYYGNKYETNTNDDNEAIPNYNETTPNNSNDSQNQYPNYEYGGLPSSLDDKSEKIINSVISFDGNLMTAFISETSNMEVYYPYHEYYKISEALNAYNSNSLYAHSSDEKLIKNNKIDVDDLYNVVLENNEKANFASNRCMDSANIRKICTIICDTINDYLKNNDADIDLLNSQLLNLKIQKYSEMSYANYDNLKGIMRFDINKINKSDKFYRSITQHETYHLIQSSSVAEIETCHYINRMGVCYKFPNLEVNSLYWDWYFEGAAEYLTMNKNNTMDSELYSNIIDSFNLIKISCALNSNYKINSFENFSLQNNLNNFFDYFDVITKEEVATLMFAYNIINSPNSFSTSTDFYNIYKEVNGTSMSVEEKMKFERKLKNSITQTETKLFYSYLAKNISSKNVKIEDVFALITLFESNINIQNRYYVAEYYYEEYSDFFELYMEIQNEFFQIIASKLNVNLSDVYDAYNAYNEYKKINIVDSGILNKEQKNFYVHILNKKTSVMDTVNYKYNHIINGQYKK